MDTRLFRPPFLAVVGALALLVPGFACKANVNVRALEDSVQSGTLVVAIADDFARKRATRHIYLDRPGKPQLEVLLDLQLGARVVTGTKARVTGRLKGRILDARGKHLEVTSYPALAAVPAAQIRRVLVTLVDIVDGQGQSHLVNNTCDGILPDMLFGAVTNARNVDGCYADSSFNGLGMGGAAYPGSQSDVVRVSINETELSLSGVCNLFDWADAADAQAAAQVVLPNYQHRVYVFPVDAGCGWSGLAYTGCGDDCRAFIMDNPTYVCSTKVVWAHELGHNLGFMHAVAPGDGNGDESDFMGNAGANLVTTNAPHRIQMGWIAGAGVVDGTAGGTFTLSSMGLISPAFPQAVKITPAIGDPYYLSYRTAVGYDSALPSRYLDKLNLHRWPGGITETIFIKALADNQSFSDNINGLTITQLAHDSQTATISIANTGVEPIFASIQAGFTDTCALTTTGAALCWGSNFFGQLGDGSTTDRLTPALVTGLGSGAQAISPSWYHTCAVSSMGTALCWGSNFDGSLGDGTTTDSLTPVPVSGLGNGVQAMATGYGHSCALTTAGAVRCWGYNGWGQLGDGTTTERHSPVPVSGLGSGVKAIVAGSMHTCALTTAGAVLCWGYNANGQLGDGTITGRSIPVPVAGLSSGVQAIAAGVLDHTCALTSAGAVRCWGENSNGQLGDGTTTGRSTSVPVTGLGSGVQAIAVGGRHTCALTIEGVVQCFGVNENGELGDGTTTQRLTPVPVAGLGSAAKAIATGGGHTCALTTDGVAWCWGANQSGSLGDGTSISRLTPVPVIFAVTFQTRLLSIADVNISEGNSGTKQATFAVELSSVSDAAVTFDIATSDGSAVAASDYVARSLNGQAIAAGQTSKTFTVTINGDATVEPNEAFTVSLSNVVGATVLYGGRAKGTIINDEGSTLSIADVALAEGNSGTSLATFTVQLSEPSVGPVTYNIGTYANSATAGSDYILSNLAGQSIPAGQTSKTFSVTINGDSTPETDELFIVSAANVAGATVVDALAVGRILDDDSTTLSIANVSIPEGNSGTKTVTFTVSLSQAATGAVSFDVFTDAGTASPDDDFVSKTILGQTIVAGQTSASFVVTINGDSSVEGNETFTVNLANVVGAGVSGGQAQGRIVNDDLALLSIADSSVQEGNSGASTATFIVRLSAPMPNPVFYDIATGNGTAIGGSDFVVRNLAGRFIDAGRTVHLFEVGINGDTTAEANETFSVNISNLSGATLADGSALGTIVNDDGAALRTIRASTASVGAAIPVKSQFPPAAESLRSKPLLADCKPSARKRARRGSATAGCVEPVRK